MYPGKESFYKKSGLTGGRYRPVPFVGRAETRRRGAGHMPDSPARSQSEEPPAPAGGSSL